MKKPSSRPDGDGPREAAELAADDTRCVYVLGFTSIGPTRCLRVRARTSRSVAGRLRQRRRIVLWAVAILLGSWWFCDGQGVAQPLETGDLTSEETAFLSLVVNRYRMADLGRRWIDDRLKTVSAKSRADLEFARADCLRAEGKTDEYTEELNRLRSKYPTHQRAKAAELTVIQATMYKVLLLHSESLDAGEGKAALVSERDRLYRVEVREALDQTIAELQKEHDQIEDKFEKERRESSPDVRKVEELGRQLRNVNERLDQWASYRVTAARVFAERQDEGSDSARKAWQDVLDLATGFVETRWENFILVCENQLIRGNALAELGQVEEAAGELDLLVEMRPPLDPPYPPAVIQFIRRLRLQAIEGTARAWNQSGRPEDAVAVFNRVAENRDPQFPLDTAGEDPTLLGFVIAADIEEAIARTVVGEDGRGVRKFEDLLKRWTADKQAAPAIATGFLLDISRGLSRLLDLGAGNLPPLFYRHAGTGYQLRGQMDRAILTWKRGLEIGSQRAGFEALCADMLNQMGQTYYLTGREPEAGFCFLAVRELYKTQASETVAALAAQNSFAVFDKLAARGKAWQEESAVAYQWFRETAGGEIAQLLIIEKASEEEAKGNYQRARDLYKSVQKEIDGKRSRSYGNGVASAARCLFLHKRADGKAQEGATEALQELATAATEAASAGDEAARAAIAFQAASIHWDEAVRDRDKALAALAPFGTSITGKGDARELALYLWLSILLPDDSTDAPTDKDLAAADAVFAMIARDFGNSERLPDQAIRMIEIHNGSGAEQSRVKAAEYVELFTKLPAIKLESLEPGSLLFLARPLALGGKTGLARSVLELAKAALAQDSASDVELEVSTTWLLAQVLLMEDKPNEVQPAIEPLIERHGEEIRGGGPEDSPRIYTLQARALLLSHQDRPSAALLKQAEDAQTAGLGILDQRRSGMRSRGKVPPSLEREYWEAWLQLLNIWKAQGRKEDVVKQLRSFEVMRSTFPTGLVEAFEQLKKECQR